MKHTSIDFRKCPLRADATHDTPETTRVCRPPLLRYAALCVLLAGASFEACAAAHYHEWTRTQGIGLWTYEPNWLLTGSSDHWIPEGGDDCNIMFGYPNTGALRLSTNNLPIPGEGYYRPHRSIRIYQGGFELYGNHVWLNYLLADYPAGTNSTIHLDIHPYSSAATPSVCLIEVSTNNSSLVLAGQVIRTGSFLSVPITIIGDGDLTISGIISGGTRIDKSSSGILTFNGRGANVYYGVTYVHDGILRLGRWDVMPGPVVVGAVAVPGNLEIGTDDGGFVSDIVVLDRDDQIGNDSGVLIRGTGQLELNGHDDLIGDLYLRGGNVLTGSGILGFGSPLASIHCPTNTSLISGMLHLGDDGRTYSRDVVVAPDALLRVPAVISGAANVELCKTDEGELILAGANTYEGPTRLLAGVLTLQNNRALGSNGYGTTLSGGALRLENVAVAAEPLTVDGPASILNHGGSNFWGGTITLDESLSIMVSNASTLVLSNTIDGSGNLAKGEAGILKLIGKAANTCTGTTEACAGTLLLAKSSGRNAVAGDLIVGDAAGGPEADVVQWAADEQIANTSAVDVTASGLLDLNGNDETFRLLTGSGAVNVGSGNLTVSNDVDHVFHGTFRGGQAGEKARLTKTGLGTWTWTGTHEHYHRTLVAGGTLRVDGVLTHSSVQVDAGGCLAGTGTVQGVSFLERNSLLSPGPSVGRLVAQGTVVMDSGTLEVELNGLEPGTGYDQLVTDVAPTLTRGSLEVLPGFSPPLGSTFIIITNRSASPVSGTFSGKLQDAAFAAGGWVFQINYMGGNGNDVVLTRVEAPAVSNLVASATGGQVHLQAQGFAGAAYVLKAAPHLNSPIPWQTIQTNLANGFGLVQFADADMPLYAQRFYRVTSP